MLREKVFTSPFSLFSYYYLPHSYQIIRQRFFYLRDLQAPIEVAQLFVMILEIVQQRTLQSLVHLADHKSTSRIPKDHD